MAMIQAPKGTKDIYGEEMRYWRRLENEIRTITELHGFSEIRTPVIEHTELFLRGVGETTDVVQKEMYSFQDKAGREISLRPEITAGAARAYVEHGMHINPQPTKFFYMGPNFRYEKPQAGRYRQHHQFGVEIFGAESPAAETEIISLGFSLLEKLNVRGVTLHINSIGCAECRKIYQRRLKDFLGSNLSGLCATCRERFEKNPLRVLDCKMATCKAILENAPSVIDALDDDCRAHFESLRQTLSALGIPFLVDPKVVRGLDYYTRTVFEFIHDGLTVIGGGRYDGLIEEVGGAATPAVGFGMGMERLVLLLQKTNDEAPENAQADGPAVFLANAGEKGFQKAQALTYALRKAGVSAEYDLLNRSVKAQMKYANKINARFTAVLGDDEIEKGEALLKDMNSGESSAVAITDGARLIERIGKGR
ncbi:MAG: histidine--tRNA ligase [Clostridiales bacterium]|jgi:histidyl-tRNA synthetase|nr:histidine--tRNA ligase [Clostridiales bacterium]